MTNDPINQFMAMVKDETPLSELEDADDAATGVGEEPP